MKLGVFFFLSVVMLLFPHQTSSYISIGVSTRGLDFMKNAVLDFLKPKLEKLKIKDFSEKNYAISKIQIQSLNLGRTNYAAKFPNDFTVSVSRASARITANWKAWKRIGFITVRASGTSTVTGSDVRISQDIDLEKEKNKPAFEIGKCKTSIGDFKVKLKGKNFLLTAIYNLIIGFFKGRIRREIEKAICKTAVKELGNRAKDLTGKYPVSRYLALGSNINLALEQSPRILNNRITATLNGQCYSIEHNSKQRFPFRRQINPSLPSSTKMVYLSVDEYMLNTLLYSVYQNNQLELKLTSRQMKLSSVFGRTITARELVRFIRPLQRYGSAPLQFGLDASSAPKAQITSSGVTVTGTFTLYVNVEKPDGSTEQVFRFTVRVNASLKPKIDDNRIKADVTRFTATGVDRRRFPQSFIDTTVDKLLLNRLNYLLRSITGSGLILPKLYRFKPYRLSVKTKTNVIEVGSDFTD